VTAGIVDALIQFEEGNVADIDLVG